MAVPMAAAFLPMVCPALIFKRVRKRAPVKKAWDCGHFVPFLKINYL